MAMPVIYFGACSAVVVVVAGFSVVFTTGLIAVVVAGLSVVVTVVIFSVVVTFAVVVTVTFVLVVSTLSFTVTVIIVSVADAVVVLVLAVVVTVACSVTVVAIISFSGSDEISPGNTLTLTVQPPSSERHRMTDKTVNSFFIFISSSRPLGKTVQKSHCQTIFERSFLARDR